jgi:hypothetical protein
VSFALLRGVFASAHSLASEANPRRPISVTQTDVQLQVSACIKEQNSMALILDYQIKNIHLYRVTNFAPTSHLTLAPSEVATCQIVLPTTSNNHHIATAHFSKKPQGSVNLTSELHHSSV